LPETVHAAAPRGVAIRHVRTHDEFVACVELQTLTWGAAFRELVPATILKITQRVGGVTAGAFAADGTLLGFVFGITGVEHGLVVHWSDMLAVRPEAQGLGIGRQLKLFQREAVRALGAAHMYWTYDRSSPATRTSTSSGWARACTSTSPTCTAPTRAARCTAGSGPTASSCAGRSTGAHRTAPTAGRARRSSMRSTRRCSIPAAGPTARPAPSPGPRARAWCASPSRATSSACSPGRRPGSRLATGNARGVQWALAHGYHVAGFAPGPRDGHGPLLLARDPRRPTALHVTTTRAIP
jgi:GNAT superfamily N-acetyltransferase